MISGRNISALDQPQVLEYLFHPQKDYKPSCPQGAMDYFINVETGIQIGARFFLDEPLNPHILFFHGRDEIVSDYDNIGLSCDRFPTFSAMAKVVLPVP